ncbi:hypothetical protein KR067_007253, partial [Drosophila pandora]
TKFQRKCGIHDTSKDLILKFQDAVVFKMTNAVCKSYNQSWVVFELCRLKAVGRDKVVFNMIGNILHPTNSVHVHLDVLKKANGFKPWVISSKLDVCRYFRKKYNPFAAMVHTFFGEFSNFNHTCPYVGPFIIKGFYLRHELLLLPIPSGEYMLATKRFYSNRHQHEVNITFHYTEDLR